MKIPSIIRTNWNNMLSLPAVLDRQKSWIFFIILDFINKLSKWTKQSKGTDIVYIH